MNKQIPVGNDAVAAVIPDMVDDGWLLFTQKGYVFKVWRNQQGVVIRKLDVADPEKHA